MIDDEQDDPIESFASFFLDWLGVALFVFMMPGIICFPLVIPLLLWWLSGLLPWPVMVWVCVSLAIALWIMLRHLCGQGASLDNVRRGRVVRDTRHGERGSPRPRRRRKTRFDQL